MVAFLDHVAGAEDFVQDIVEIGAVGAGDIGADLAAFAIKRVAGSARALEDSTTVGEVCFCEDIVGKEQPELHGLRALVVVRLGERPPEIDEARSDNLTQLAGRKGGYVALRNRAFLQLGEK